MLRFYFVLMAYCVNIPLLWAQNSDILQFVNPFVGTDAHGHTYPGATTPFGMVQLSPDTRPSPTDWDGCAGYHYTDTAIFGFSHTHLSGTGVADYCDVLLLPTQQDAYTHNQSVGFYKKWEKAEPAYYKTILKNNIKAELTATPRCGIHRYTFAPNAPRNVALNLLFRDELLGASIKIINKNTIVGYRKSKGWAAQQSVYFCISFSENILKTTATDSSIILLKFKQKTDRPLLIKVGISGVDINGATQNLRTEAPHFDFEKYKTQAQMLWTHELEKIQVQGGSLQQLTTFYTAAYHCYLAPNVFSDVSGAYLGTDRQPHHAQNDTYTVFSLWDTYRAAHPLYTLTQPQRTCDFIYTFAQQYQQSGRLPVWELAANETNCMIGYHAVPVIVDAYLKGMTCPDLDAELLYQACIASANENRLGKWFYIKNGYIAQNQDAESVSKTLEYAYDDWCIAQFAKKLGKKNDYNTYLRRSFGYQNIFDPETHTMRPKSNQLFKTPFDAREIDFNYTEGNAWQYSFYVPHNVPHLVAMHGGTQSFEQKLDALFQDKTATTGRTQADVTGLIGQYAHGNEPSHHIAYLYNYTKNAHKTQALTRQIMTELYSHLPDGLCGNEDCGQMSAWYVFGALGFYPVNPVGGVYQVSAPLFKNARLQLPNGKQLNILAPNNSAVNKYVRTLTLNGKKIENQAITHQQILDGGTLFFEMDSIFTLDATRPDTLYIAQKLPLAMPYLRTIGSDNAFVFTDSLRLLVQHPSTNATIIINEKKYKNNDIITLKNTTELTMQAIQNGDSSHVAYAQFRKNNSRRTATIPHKYNAQYTAGGDNGIVNGLRGSSDFRLGGWQGYQYVDFEATINLGESKEIYKVGAGFLQDVRSWIWFPTRLEFWGSNDGKNYDKIQDVAINENPQDYTVQARYFGKRIEPMYFTYLKVKATSYGTIPAWHGGAGDGAFIFVDEILLNDEE